MISRRLQIFTVLLVLAILAMGGYFVHLKRKAEAIATPQVQQALVAPVNGPAETTLLFLPNDEDGTLHATSVTAPQPADPGERARLALHMLIARGLAKDSPHPYGPGADVHDVFLMDPNSAVVNLNQALVAGLHPGIQSEQLTLFSMVLTLKSQLPQLMRVRFLVEGKSAETLAGHVDISGWMDVIEVQQSTPIAH
jgi:hypothetical protein